jgi:hypothetical protein
MREWEKLLLLFYVRGGAGGVSLPCRLQSFLSHPRISTQRPTPGFLEIDIRKSRGTLLKQSKHRSV